MNIKKNQVWRDKKTGDLMKISNKSGEMFNVVFTNRAQGMGIHNSHKMNQFTILRYYELT